MPVLNDHAEKTTYGSTIGPARSEIPTPLHWWSRTAHESDALLIAWPRNYEQRLVRLLRELEEGVIVHIIRHQYSTSEHLFPDGTIRPLHALIGFVRIVVEEIDLIDVTQHDGQQSLLRTELQGPPMLQAVGYEGSGYLAASGPKSR